MTAVISKAYAVVVGSREDLIFYAKLIYEKTRFCGSLGNVEHIRGNTAAHRHKVLCDTCSFEDIILISTHRLSEEQLEEAQGILCKSNFVPV